MLLAPYTQQGWGGYLHLLGSGDTKERKGSLSSGIGKPSGYLPNPAAWPGHLHLDAYAFESGPQALAHYLHSWVGLDVALIFFGP